jgi:hypothetical protein
LAHKPIGQICTAERAGRNCTTIAIDGNLLAYHRLAADEGGELIGGFRAASVLQAVFAPAKLVALGCVNTPEPNAPTVDFEGVTIDNARLSLECIGPGFTAPQQKYKRSDKWEQHWHQRISP